MFSIKAAFEKQKKQELLARQRVQCSEVPTTGGAPERAPFTREGSTSSPSTGAKLGKPKTGQKRQGEQAAEEEKAGGGRAKARGRGRGKQAEGEDKAGGGSVKGTARGRGRGKQVAKGEKAGAEEQGEAGGGTKGRGRGRRGGQGQGRGSRGGRKKGNDEANLEQKRPRVAPNMAGAKGSADGGTPAAKSPGGPPAEAEEADQQQQQQSAAPSQYRFPAGVLKGIVPTRLHAKQPDPLDRPFAKTTLPPGPKVNFVTAAETDMFAVVFATAAGEKDWG